MEEIKIKYFNSIGEAELAKALLTENGIEGMLQKNDRGFLDSSGDLMGATLFVMDKDLEKAKKILKIE